MRVRTVSLLLSFLVFVAFATGCSTSRGVDESAPPTSSSVTKMLASLGEGESGSLRGVSLSAASGGAIDAGTREDELLRSGYRQAQVGVFREINGIETRLMIPMWYGDETTIEAGSLPPASMLEAAEATRTMMGQAYWFGDPVAAVYFHMDEGVLVLDRAVVPMSR